jgi:DNA invertase Pin-like site-specific DNA recombinase
MKIGYARISTREQSFQLQVDSLKAAGCEKIYQEVASGAKTARVVLDELLKNIRKDDILVVWKLDRLGRNLVHLRQTVDELKNREIGLLSLTEEIDTNTATGLLFFNFFGIIAEFERGKTIERVNAGLRSARARGRVGGRPKGLSEKSRNTAKIAAVLYNTGDISIRSICQQLDITFNTLYRYLRHEGVEVGASPVRKILTFKKKENVNFNSQPEINYV